MLVLFDRDSNEVLDIVPYGKIVDGCIAAGERKISAPIRCAWAIIAEQDVSALARVDTQTGTVFWSGKYPASFSKPYMTPEQQARAELANVTEPKSLVELWAIVQKLIKAVAIRD